MSYVRGIDHHTQIATQHIGLAQNALKGLLTSPEIGFAIDPDALKTELDAAMDQLLKIRRMVRAAQQPAAPA